MWSALKFRGVWIIAPALTPALHLLLQKQNFVNKKNSEKIFLQIFLLLTHSLLRSNVRASTFADREPSFIDVTFHVQSSSIIEIIQNNCANGTKKNFKDRTIVFQALVQDGGAVIS